MWTHWLLLVFVLCIIFLEQSLAREVLVHLNLPYLISSSQVFDTVMYSLISAVASTLKLNYESRYKVIYLSLDNRGCTTKLKFVNTIMLHKLQNIYAVINILYTYNCTLICKISWRFKWNEGLKISITVRHCINLCLKHFEYGCYGFDMLI